MCAMPLMRSSAGVSADTYERCGTSSASPSVEPSSSCRTSSTEAVVVDPQDPPHQRVAVGVQPARRQPQQRVASADAAAVHDALALDGPHHEPHQLNVLAVVHAGHLRRLPADERAPKSLAGPREAHHELLDFLRGQRAHAHVVEEEEGLGAAGEDVVGAVVDDVLADSVVAPHQARDAQLGAHAVRVRHQHRVAVAGDLVQRAKRANVAEQRPR